jgi:hypothetical protein
MLGLNWDCRPIAIKSARPFSRIASACCFENDAHRHRRDGHFLADPFGVGHLEAEAARDLGCGRRARNAAGGAVDHVDAAGLQFPGEGYRVIQIPAVLCTLDGGDADK